jgi:hypothetical protein
VLLEVSAHPTGRPRHDTGNPESKSVRTAQPVADSAAGRRLWPIRPDAVDAAMHHRNRQDPTRAEAKITACGHAG